MEIQLDTQALPASVPVPVFSSIKIGDTEHNGVSFEMYIGLNNDQVTKLKHLSLDTTDVTLQEHTSDYKRFGEGSYEEWYAKKRVPFELIHKETGALAALAWFGPKPLGRKSLRLC